MTDLAHTIAAAGTTLFAAFALASLSLTLDAVTLRWMVTPGGVGLRLRLRLSQFFAGACACGASVVVAVQLWAMAQ